MFMFACSFAFMFPCTFAFALAVGLGEAVTIVFTLALLFVFSVVVQPAPSAAKTGRVIKQMIRRISIPPVKNKVNCVRGQSITA